MTEGKSKISAGFSAWALGIAVLSLPAAAWADPQNGQHHGGSGNAAPQKPAAPAGGGGWVHPAGAPNQPHPAPAAGGGWHPQGNPQGGPQGGGWHPQGGAQGGPQGGGFTQGRPTYPQGGQAYQQRQPGFQGQPRENGAWHGNGGQWVQGQGYGRPGGNGQWNHGWRQDNRYDWRGWRSQNGDIFHAGRYYPPYRGYYYNRLTIGYFLQPYFFANDYWITDPGYYHLPPAYGPYQWVRYYNDVLLVNTYTGEVADVIYDFFW